MSNTNPIEIYREAYEEMARHASAEPKFLGALREAAFTSFVDGGFPTTRWESWKYTDVKKLGRTAYQHAARVDFAWPSRKELEGSRFSDALELVFINGQYAPELSTVASKVPGVHLQSIASVLRDDPKQLKGKLGEILEIEEHPFAALNTAFISDGAFLYIEPGAKIPGVIHILHVAGTPDEDLVVHPRTLIVAGANSEATVVESFVGIEGTAYFTNAVAEVRVGERATLKHFVVDRHSAQGNHVGNIHVEQTGNSAYESHTFWLGGELVRNDLEVHLKGSGAHAKLNGLYLANGRQHMDNHTLLDHAVPECSSEENYKGILGGHAHGVFNGRVLVQKDAQKTDAQQANRNLLLTDTANIDTKPQLEIYADDVKCSHGTTVGQLDDLALFYLQSRGIPREEAFHMLTSAFTEDLMDEISNPQIGAYVRKLVREQLSLVQMDRAV